MSAWSWLVLGIGMWVFQAPFAALLLAKYLKTCIEKETNND